MSIKGKEKQSPHAHICLCSKGQRDHVRCCRRHGQVDGKGSKGKGKKRGREEKPTGQTGPAEKGKEAALEKVSRSSLHATVHIRVLTYSHSINPNQTILT